MTNHTLAAVLAAVLGTAGDATLADEGDVKAEQLRATNPAATDQRPIPISMAGRDHLFEEREGTWKATCDEMEDSRVYCRMFHIEQFGEWKTKNFVQLGPAFSPEAAGFVVATYLGFKEGTTVTIGIDKHDRHRITAPKGNNLMIGPEVTRTILEQMEHGHKIVITFNSHSGVRHLSLADLAPYRVLLAQVKMQMKGNSEAAGAGQ